MAFTEAQKRLLQMCLEACERGRDRAWISRSDLISGRATPADTPRDQRMSLLRAALTLPRGVLEWSHGRGRFRLTEKTQASLLMSAERRRALGAGKAVR